MFFLCVDVSVRLRVFGTSRRDKCEGRVSWGDAVLEVEGWVIVRSVLHLGLSAWLGQLGNGVIRGC